MVVRLCTVVLAALFAFAASAGVPITSTTIAINPDGTHQSAYVNDSAPAGLLAFSGLKGGVENAGSQNILQGTPFSHEICQYLTGTEKATATLSVVGVTGDPVTRWSLSASNCATTSNLQNSATTLESGTALVRAVGASSSDDSDAFAWIVFTPDPGDTGFAFPCAPTCSETTSSATLVVTPSFNNISLEWGETSGSTTNEAIVRYRVVGTSTWKQAISMWWDNRTQGTAGGQIPYGFKQYRSSIVQVASNTTYEIEVMTQTAARKFATTQVTTWNETFPIGVTVEPAASSATTLVINTSGTAGGYRLYTRAGGWTIDANNVDAQDNAVEIDASYVIIRGLTCREVDKFCVTLSANSHHIVIEDSDFSNMGTVGSAGFACRGSGGITTPDGTNFSITNIVVQNVVFHDPLFDSNSWEEARSSSETPSGCVNNTSNHPVGSVPIEFNNTGGGHVIRYNRVYADATHMWKDGFSGQQNFSHNGDVRKDTDIYRNKFSHIWDDTIQTEGANQNVRIYENFSEQTMVQQGHAAVAIGPLYMWRNVMTCGVRGPDLTCGGNSWFYKSQTKPAGAAVNALTIGGGASYAINNTMYRTSSADGVNQAVLFVDDGASLNSFWFNNVINVNSQLTTTNRTRIQDNGDWEDNVYTTGHTMPNTDAGGTATSPTYEAAHASGPYTPATGSVQLDTGTVIANFTDGFLGAAPDRGAVERGQTAVIYGPQ